MIENNLKKILGEIPAGVKLVVASKGKTTLQIEEAIAAGAEIIGENYIQEAKRKQNIIGHKVEWHLIGHLQKNKIKKAVTIFDMIETLDSLPLALQLDKECKTINKIMPVLIEVNIAKEVNKSGVYPEVTEKLIDSMLNLNNIKVMGLMTMGPFLDDPERLRPYFRKLKDIFDKISSRYSNQPDFKYLSMGMSSSYKVAIDEGANLVRLGAAIFGKQNKTL